jgi:hypothetical protein
MSITRQYHRRVYEMLGESCDQIKNIRCERRRFGMHRLHYVPCIIKGSQTHNNQVTLMPIHFDVYMSLYKYLSHGKNLDVV